MKSSFARDYRPQYSGVMPLRPNRIATGQQWGAIVCIANRVEQLTNRVSTDTDSAVASSLMSEANKLGKAIRSLPVEEADAAQEHHLHHLQHRHLRHHHQHSRPLTPHVGASASSQLPLSARPPSAPPVPHHRHQQSQPQQQQPQQQPQAQQHPPPPIPRHQPSTGGQLQWVDEMARKPMYGPEQQHVFVAATNPAAGSARAPRRSKAPQYGYEGVMPHIGPVRAETSAAAGGRITHVGEAEGGIQRVSSGPQLDVAAHVKVGTKRKRRRTDKGDKSCRICSTNSTPEWRRGPDGRNTLCNACGLNYSKRLRRERKSLEALGRRRESIDRVINEKKDQCLAEVAQKRAPGRAIRPPPAKPKRDKGESPSLEDYCLSFALSYGE